MLPGPIRRMGRDDTRCADELTAVSKVGRQMALAMAGYETLTANLLVQVHIMRNHIVAMLHSKLYTVYS